MATITVKAAGGGDFTTIAAALASIGTVAGDGADDIVEVYNGTYLEGILNTLPSGTSWAHPFILRVAAGNTATIKKTGERNIFIYEPTSLAFYSIIRGFILDGTNLSSDQVAFSAAESAPSSIRLEDCELIHTENENGILTGAFATDIQLINNHIHGGDFFTTANVSGHNHGIYHQGSDSLIEGNHIHDVPGFGIHQYSQESPSPDDNIIRENEVHDACTGTFVGAGILVTSGHGSKCYRNVVYDIQGVDNDGGVGISVGGTANQIFNNTVYDCSFIGLDANGSTGAIIKNNIAYLNGQNTDFTGANGVAAIGLIQSNNLIGIDPLFFDPDNADFTLRSGSPAIDYGTPYGGLLFNDAAPDAGAFETASRAPPPEPPPPEPPPEPPPPPGTGGGAGGGPDTGSPGGGSGGTGGGTGGSGGGGSGGSGGGDPGTVDETGWGLFESGCGECVPEAPDGMEQVDSLFTEPPLENATSASWSFVQDNVGGEIIYQAATNSPFPNNHQLYVSTNGVVSAVTYPSGIDSNSNLTAGIADRPLFAWSSGGGFYLFSLDNGSQVTMVLGGHGFSGSAVRNWSVNGNIVFWASQDIDVGGDFVLAKYNAVTGAFIDFTTIPDQTSIVSLHWTGTFVYVLAANSGDGTYTILKYDEDLVLVDDFVLTVGLIPSVTGFIGLFAETDDMIWLLSFETSDLDGAYYLRDFTELVTVDAGIAGTAFVPAAAPYVVQVHQDATTSTRYIYMSSSGGYPIVKLGPIVCAS